MTLAHQGFVYGSTDDFVATLVPLVRAALERGDPVFVGAGRAGVEAMREALGTEADAVDLRDTETWEPRPFDRLLAVRRMVDTVPAGSRMLALGEPVWTESESINREWARYESVINVALARAPLRFVCVYDGAALEEDLLVHGRHTHGEMIEAGAVCACDAFVDPEEYVPALGPDFDSTPASMLDAAVGDQRAFRRRVSAAASEAGMAEVRVEQLVLAANEVVTNALVHGSRPIRVLLWRVGDELVCQVGDAGPGIADPLAGWRVPDPAIPGGWGLPMARQLCDALEIRVRPGGARVRLHMALE